MVRSGGSLKPDELPKRQKGLRQISVSECEFSKAVDKVYLIRTGTAPVDIHVAGRLSQTSCSLHPDDSPLLKKISTLSDRHLPEDLLPLREFCLYLKRQFLRKKYKNMKFCYVKSLYFRYISKIKKFRTKIPDLGIFLYGIHCFEIIYTKLTSHLFRIFHNIFILHQIIDQGHYSKDQCDPHNNIGEDL